MNNRYFTLSIILLVIIILFVFIHRFVLKTDDSNVYIKAFDKVIISDLNQNKFFFSRLLPIKKDSYVLLFELRNCYSCIINGFEDLIKLQKSGENCIAIAIHDLIEEVKGWSINVSFNNLFVLKKIDYYKYFSAAHLPILIKIQNKKIVSYRYIKNVMI